jgi:hypothetical protein
MKSADWIAIAGIAATAITAALGFIFADRQAKNSAALALGDRLFSTRGRAYEDALRLIHHRWSTIDFYLRATEEGGNAEPPDEPFSSKEMGSLQMKMALYASKRVREPFDAFWKALSRYTVESGKLRATEKLKEVTGDATVDELDRQLKRQRDEVRGEAKKASNALADAELMMHKDLTDAFV